MDQKEKNRWHNQYIDGCLHFCTYTVRDWRPILIENVKDALYEEWDKARTHYSVRICAYVIMPDHVHMMLWSEDGKNVELFLRRILGQTSKRFRTDGKRFWKERPRVFPVYTESVAHVKIEYIHNNPVKRGLVGDSSGWLDSSFKQLIMGDSKVPFVCDGFPEGIG
ncbi:MAG: transposase [Armatimonadota bacterium]